MSSEDFKTKPRHEEKNNRTQLKDPADASRRDFLKISGVSLAIPMIVGPQVISAAGHEVHVHGPGQVAIELSINHKKYRASLEPRVTLLDALRDQFGLTGAKRVCDRAECGACTVLMNEKAVYACSVLAIEAQGAEILTVETLLQENKLHPVQQAFVDNDALQCGFCTPGFVVACRAFLDKHPSPTPEDIRRGLSGNFCRCGTYDGIKKAIAQLAQEGG
jgi:xanthine dehydrogenase YagT iron-sulfur-binding subunit